MSARTRRPRANTAVSIACFLVAAVILGGCGSLLPSPGPAPHLYTLTPKSTFRDDLPAAAWQLVVEEPTAAGGLATHSIALRTNPIEMQYFASARWSERAPRMVQTLIVESFENTGRIVAVGRETIGLRSDYNLKIEMREFQAEYDTREQAPRVRVRINAKIIAQPRREIIASRTFEQVVTAASTDIEAVIYAFDEALGQVLKGIVEWTLISPGPG